MQPLRPVLATVGVAATLWGAVACSSDGAAPSGAAQNRDGKSGNVGPLSFALLDASKHEYQADPLRGNGGNKLAADASEREQWVFQVPAGIKPTDLVFKGDAIGRFEKATVPLLS